MFHCYVNNVQRTLKIRNVVHKTNIPAAYLVGSHTDR